MELREPRHDEPGLARDDLNRSLSGCPVEDRRGSRPRKVRGSRERSRVDTREWAGYDSVSGDHVRATFTFEKASTAG